MSVTSHPLWDIPTRLCHWLIALCIPLSWWSAEEERYELHQWSGYTLIVLVVGRVIWGFIGSRHSRFSDFLVGPGKVLTGLARRAYPDVTFLTVGTVGELADIRLRLDALLGDDAARTEEA